MEKSKNRALKIASFFYKDIQWKLLALALAFILWFVGINVNNPAGIEAYNHIPLTVLNRDQLAANDIVLLNDNLTNQFVSVSIRATRSAHVAIQADRSNIIQASVDLSSINFEQVLEADGPVDVQLDIDLFIHEDYMIGLPRPNFVTLSLDRHGVRTMPIEVDVLGTPMEGFVQRQPVLSTSLVQLTGARSLLDQAARVEVGVFAGDAYETVESIEPLVVFNSNREIITDTINLSAVQVQVRVPIYPYADIPLRVNTIGTAMPGFMATEIVIDPPAVSVIGSAEEIEATGFINLGDVDLTMASQDEEYRFDIRQALAGTGLSLRDGAPAEAAATIVVERVISRNFYMPLDNLTVSGYAMPFEFISGGPIVLSLRGRESAIAALTLGEITASLNLTGLGAGTHTVQVDVVPPARVTLANLATVEINIEPEPIVFEPEEPPDWTADLEDIENPEDLEEAEYEEVYEAEDE